MLPEGQERSLHTRGSLIPLDFRMLHLWLQTSCKGLYSAVEHIWSSRTEVGLLLEEDKQNTHRGTSSSRRSMPAMDCTRADDAEEETECNDV